MDGFDDLIDSLGKAISDIFSDSTSGIEDFSPFSDVNLGDCSTIISDFASGNFIDNGSEEFYSGMESALNRLLEDTDSSLDTNSNISFEGSMSHHEPFSRESDFNTDNISFEGNGDKYTDNAYNQAQADKWLAKEQECLAKGDKTGAAAAHSTAINHLKRIKS